MLVLFDNGSPRTLARFLIDRHTVTEARAGGWEELENGELLNEAEAAGFEVLVTTDKNLGYQQNLAGRNIDTSWCWVKGDGPHQATCPVSRCSGECRHPRQLH